MRQQGQQGLCSGEALAWGMSLSDLSHEPLEGRTNPCAKLVNPAPAAGTCVPEIMAQAVLHHLSLLAVITPISHGVIPKGQPQGPSCQQQWGHPSCCFRPSGFRKHQQCSPHTWFQGLICVKGAGWLMKPSYLCPSRTFPSLSKQHPKCRTGWEEGVCQ